MNEVDWNKWLVADPRWQCLKTWKPGMRTQRCSECQRTLGDLVIQRSPWRSTHRDAQGRVVLPICFECRDAPKHTPVMLQYSCQCTCVGLTLDQHDDIFTHGMPDLDDISEQLGLFGIAHWSTESYDQGNNCTEYIQFRERVRAEGGVQHLLSAGRVNKTRRED